MICSECARGDHDKCRGCPCRHKSELRVDLSKLKKPLPGAGAGAGAGSAA